MSHVDLHIHTAYSSDGDYSPEHILSLAKSVGLRAIAIADHDTTEGAEIARELCDKYDLEIIPCVEITTFFDGKEMHVLGYLIDLQSETLQSQLTQIRYFDEMRIKEVVNSLQSLGVDVEYEEAKALSPTAVPKCSVVVNAAMSNGRNDKLPLFSPYREGPKAQQPYHNFFLDYLRPGQAAYTEPTFKYSTTDALRLVVESGGFPVLAHPGGSLRLPTEMPALDALRLSGLAGLEVYSSYHTASTERLLLQYTEKFGLLATAGSDFHGPTVKPNIHLGRLRHNPYSLVERLRDARLPKIR